MKIVIDIRIEFTWDELLMLILSLKNLLGF